jgi:hypothetical protein
MIQTNIESDFDKVALQFKKNANNIDRATASAINKVASQVSTESKNAITETYTVKKGEIKTRISKASPISFNAEVAVYSKKLGLSLPKFKVGKQLKKGVKVSVKKGTPKLFRKAFKQTMPSGHKGVFYRQGDKRFMTKGRYAGKKYKRQPIVERFGPNVPVLFASRKVNNRMLKKIQDKFPSILTHEIEYYANK